MYDDRAPDTHVRYRTDGLGRRVAILPASCKLGHSLHKVGYRADENPAQRVVRVACERCRDGIEVDHFWTLTTSGAAPDYAELDDTPYVGIEPVMIEPLHQRR